MGTGHALTGNLRFRTEELVFKVIETAGVKRKSHKIGCVSIGQ